MALSECETKIMEGPMSRILKMLESQLRGEFYGQIDELKQLMADKNQLIVELKQVNQKFVKLRVKFCF